MTDGTLSVFLGQASQSPPAPASRPATHPPLATIPARPASQPPSHPASRPAGQPATAGNRSDLDPSGLDGHQDTALSKDNFVDGLPTRVDNSIIGFVIFIVYLVESYYGAHDQMRFARFCKTLRDWGSVSLQHQRSNLMLGGIVLVVLMFQPVAEGSTLVSAAGGIDSALSVVGKTGESVRRALQNGNELTPYAPVGCDLDAALQALATADEVCCLGLAQAMPWPVDPTNQNGANTPHTSCTDACSIACAAALLPLQSGFISMCSPMIDAILDGGVLDGRAWTHMGANGRAGLIDDMVARCSADIRAADVLARLLTLSEEGQCEGNGISLNGVAEQYVSNQGAVPPPPPESQCTDALGPGKCATCISSGHYSCEDDFCLNCLLSGECDQTCGICGRHRRELGSGLRSLQSVVPCSATDFVALAAQVTASCCNDLEGNCDSGVATSCDAECGAIFVPFFAACSVALTTFHPDEMDAMAALDATCRALPVMDLLAAVTYCEGETVMACPELQPPANMEIEYSSQERVYMSTVTYTARPGFTLVGDASFTCLINGSWSGEPYARFGYTDVSDCVAVLGGGMETCFVHLDQDTAALGSISVDAGHLFIISSSSLADLEVLMDRGPDGSLHDQGEPNLHIQADFAVGGALILAGVQVVGGSGDGIQMSVEAGGEVTLQSAQMESGQVTFAGVVSIDQSSLADVELVGSSGSALNVNASIGAVALSVEAGSSCDVQDSPDLVLSGSATFSGQGIVGRFAGTAFEQMSLSVADDASLTLRSVGGSIAGLAVADSTFAMDAASTATLGGTIRFENAGVVELAGKTILSGSNLAVSGTELTLQSAQMESGQVTFAGVVSIDQSSLVDVELVGSSGSELSVSGGAMTGSTTSVTSGRMTAEAGCLFSNAPISVSGEGGTLSLSAVELQSNGDSVPLAVESGGAATVTETTFRSAAGDITAVSVAEGGSMTVGGSQLVGADGSADPFPCDGTWPVCAEEHDGPVVVQGLAAITMAAPLVCDAETGECLSDQCFVVDCGVGGTCVSPLGTCTLPCCSSECTQHLPLCAGCISQHKSPRGPVCHLQCAVLCSMLCVVLCLSFADADLLMLMLTVCGVLWCAAALCCVGAVPCCVMRLEQAVRRPGLEPKTPAACCRPRLAAPLFVPFAD
eukprot:SAG22_NODE_858_length_6831_cov_25.965538_7_plen_1155_part_01